MLNQVQPDNLTTHVNKPRGHGEDFFMLWSHGNHRSTDISKFQLAFHFDCDNIRTSPANLLRECESGNALPVIVSGPCEVRAVRADASAMCHVRRGEVAEALPALFRVRDQKARTGTRTRAGSGM
jgi:hypothetical protein